MLRAPKQNFILYLRSESLPPEKDDFRQFFTYWMCRMSRWLANHFQKWTEELDFICLLLFLLDRFIDNRTQCFVAAIRNVSEEMYKKNILKNEKLSAISVLISLKLQHTMYNSDMTRPFFFTHFSHTIYTENSFIFHSKLSFITKKKFLPNCWNLFDFV